MAVIGGDQHQCLIQVHGLQHLGHGGAEHLRFLQRAIRVAGVVGMIDAAAFDHQIIALAAARRLAGVQLGQRKARQFRQAGLGLVLAVMLEAQVIGRKQTQNRASVAAVQCPQALGVSNKLALRPGLLPIFHQVAAIIALAALAQRQEARPAAAQHNVQPALETDQLRGEIGTTGPAFGGRIGAICAFPIAERHMAINRGRRRMGDAGGGDNADAHPLPLGDLGQRARQFFRRLAGLHALIGAHVDGANAGFHAGVHGAGRAGAVSCLGVGVVGLDQGGAGHLVPGQVILLAGGRRAAIDGMLAIKDARGGERGDAHPVTNHQDDILRALRPIHHFQAGIKCGAAIGPPTVLHRRIEHRGS